MSSNESWHIQRFLIKAYRENEQFQEAKLLCEELANSDNYMTSLWAKEFLSTLPDSEENTDLSSEETEVSSENIEQPFEDSPLPTESVELPFEQTELPSENRQFISEATNPIYNPDSSEAEAENDSGTKIKKVMEIYHKAEKERDQKIVPFVVLFLSGMLIIGFWGLTGVILLIILGAGYYFYSS